VIHNQNGTFTASCDACGVVGPTVVRPESRAAFLASLDASAWLCQSTRAGAKNARVFVLCPDCEADVREKLCPAPPVPTPVLVQPEIPVAELDHLEQETLPRIRKHSGK